MCFETVYGTYILACSACLEHSLYINCLAAFRHLALFVAGSALDEKLPFLSTFENEVRPRKFSRPQIMHSWLRVCPCLSNSKKRARNFCLYSTLLIWERQGLTLLAVGVGWGALIVQSPLFDFNLSRKRIDLAEILSQKALKPRTTNKPSTAELQWLDHC